MRCESVARVSCDSFISCRLYGSKISSEEIPIRFRKKVNRFFSTVMKPIIRCLPHACGRTAEMKCSLLLGFGFSSALAALLLKKSLFDSFDCCRLAQNGFCVVLKIIIGILALLLGPILE